MAERQGFFLLQRCCCNYTGHLMHLEYSEVWSGSEIVRHLTSPILLWPIPGCLCRTNGVFKGKILRLRGFLKWGFSGDQNLQHTFLSRLQDDWQCHKARTPSMIGRHVQIGIQPPNVAAEYDVSPHFLDLLRDHIRHPTLLPFAYYRWALISTRTAC